ncbi:MAG: ABC transporter permease [Caldilineaceae bacterium]|nr:ABC transporter permease [Caldilineaceae bacterium]MCB0095342.1 ABC transporter permease [Caldilineaceae bacterium]MCB0140372.1 ABC transporter permease [Caldilineaceae bacterium]
MQRTRSRLFWPLAIFFVIFVLFLYGPISTIVILSFQGEQGGLTFPMRGFSLHWFYALFQQQRVGDFKGSFLRSFALGLIVMSICIVVGTMVGQAFRQKFRGAKFLFYLSVTSLIVPSILVSLGIGVMFTQLGWTPYWSTSGLAAHLTWTLPFALLIMMAVFNRFEKSYEEAARDLGANEVVVFRDVVLPIILPSLVGVGLFGFTLSYDEFARSALVMGEFNSLPLEIFAMTTTVTSPALYALGTVTTIFSFIMIGLFLWISQRLQQRANRVKAQWQGENASE